MTSDYIPWNILSAQLSVGVLTDGWNLAEISSVEDPDTTPPCRQFAVWVPFAASFQQPPVVHLGITGFDTDQRDSSRLKVAAEDITPDGFTVVVTTWSTSRLYSVELSWIAIGP